ncbi:MAG: D-amino-acid transaminase [Rhizomicrobium sp.]
MAYVNGRYVPHGRAAVHIEDRGLQFSDAVYEVFGVIEGVIFDEEEHLDRLERSLGELEIAMPMQRTAMKFVVREVARRNGVGNGLIYMQITRGAYRRDHPIPADQFVRPSIIMTARNMDMVSVEARRQSGVSVVTGRDERWGRCDIKSTSLLANILAKTAGRRAGAYETWLVDSEGFVTEGSSTTAWIVDKDGRVVTRNLSHAILPGVTRKVILEAAAEAQLPVEERRFTPAEAANAKEAFISAASIGAVPVVSVDGKTVGDGRSGPVCRRIQELYRIKAASRAVSSESL